LRDPSDGAPLRHRRTGEGLIIYSIGPDGVDDGGKVDPTKSLKEPGVDIGFRMYDVDKRRQAVLPPIPTDSTERDQRK
jgi:hypothetical protein